MGDPGSGGLIVLVIGRLGGEIHAFPPEGLRYIRTMNQYRIRRRVTGAAMVLLSALGVSTGVGAQAPTAPPAGKLTEVAADPGLLQKLRAGGFTLYLRHSLTDNAHPDRVPEVDLEDCTTQRPLTAAGRRLAADVGRGIAAAKIPIDPIHISPMCRVRDTAAAAFPGRDFLVDKQLMYTANLTDEQKVPILEHTRQLLSGPVAPGHNLLVIAHGPNLADLTGYFPKEATLVVFRPTAAAGFRYVASIRPELWSKLLGKNVAR